MAGTIITTTTANATATADRPEIPILGTATGPDTTIAITITTAMTRMIITAMASATASGACRAIRTMATTMPEPADGAALLKLMTWLSPSFPVGGFSYSHGLESAAHDGLITDRDGLESWLSSLIEFGSGWNDAVLFAESWRRIRAGGDIAELSELAEAMAGARERHMETTLQGQAFVRAARGWSHPLTAALSEDAPYCVAVGAVAGAHGVPLEAALSAFLQAFASNLVQASIRLGVTGQTGAVETIAALEPIVLAASCSSPSACCISTGDAAAFGRAPIRAPAPARSSASGASRPCPRRARHLPSRWPCSSWHGPR
jgi:urease accessory protein